ncbi:hypothetical protein ANCDUO_01055 [Ancylostoma duodenale]|uniref:ATP-dependent DNA helicase n=1 Tax=Ancylostoma duodenale TaxID=51022 RepID=A0A0C2H448_9BILA|nr:hypothetical protein ANCDUO_01055 [Ancylostoma duodenale]
MLREQERINSNVNLCTDIINQPLILLEDKCISASSKTPLEHGLHAPSRAAAEIVQRKVLRERNYDTEELENSVQANEPLLVPDQRLAYEAITDMIRKGHGEIFSLDAPVGTGKTFLINLLLAEV